MGRQDRKKVMGSWWKRGVVILSNDDAADNTGLFGLGSRASLDAKQENAKSGYYGFFGAKHVSDKAKRAKRGSN